MDNNYAGDNPEKRRDVSVTELFAVPNFEHWGPYNDTGHGMGAQPHFKSSVGAICNKAGFKMMSIYIVGVSRAPVDQAFVY